MPSESLRAQATPDPVIRHLSSGAKPHRLDVPAHEAVLAIELDDRQVKIARAMLAGEGVIRPLVRSAIAQLGVDLEAHDVRLEHSTLVIAGALLTMPHGPAERLMDRMKRTHRDVALTVGRAALLPHEARMSKSDIEEAMLEGRLSAAGAHADDEGTMFLPLTHHAYEFHESHPSDEVLDRVLTGISSGRLALNGVRTTTRRPSVLQSREFLVGGMDVHARGCHLVLNSRTVDDDGRTTHAAHLSAFMLDAGRTQQGERHAELWNVNGAPVALDSLRLTANAYRAHSVSDLGI